MASDRQISRRRLLKAGIGAAGLLGLGACGSPAAPPSTGTASPSAPSDSGTTGNVVLRLATWDTGDFLALYRQAFDLFQQQNPNITVEVTSTPEADYYTKLQTEVAGGTPPDLIQIGEAYTARWAASNVLLDLNPYISSDSGFGENDFFPNVIENFTYQDGVYVLPTAFVTFGLYYNKTLFDQAGIPYPDETWDWSPAGTGKYLEIAQALTVKEGNRTVQYGTMAPAGWGYYFPRIWDNGGRYLSEDRTQCLLGEPAAVEALQWIADLINAHGVAPTAESEESGFGFNSGKVAMMPQGSFMVPGLLEAPFDWGVTHHPMGPQGRHSIMFSSGFGISTQSEHPDEAWKLVSFMTQQGAEILAEPGFAVPARQSIAEKQGLYLNERTIPHNVQVFLDASEYMGLHEITPTWIQEEQIISAELSRVMAGEQTAEQAVQSIVPRINELLKG